MQRNPTDSVRSALPESIFGLPAPARLFGFEQEFRIFDGNSQVDFRQLVHKVAAAGRKTVCPAGSQGYYLKSGSLLTCDGWEAEMAAPPALIQPGFDRRLTTTARHLQEELLGHFDALQRSDDTRLTPRGYSTHLSVSSTGVDLAKVCHRYATTMAPAMMLLMDVSTSPGLLIRARQQRFEVGGDYIQPNDHLKTAGLFFVSSFLATIDAIVRGTDATIPIRFDGSRLEPTRQRLGIYTDRAAFGQDLYARGRAALLRQSNGNTVTAQQALEVIWDHVQAYATVIGEPDDIDQLSRAILGMRALPLESEVPDHTWIRPLSDRPVALPAIHPFAECLKPRHTNDALLTPHVVTWDYIVYQLETASAVHYLNVPFAWLQDWLNAIASDDAARWIAELPPVEPAAHSFGVSDTVKPGLFETIDAQALAESFDRPGPKKKKKQEEPTCQLLIDDQGNIEICMPEVSDPQIALVEQEPPQNDYRVARDVWINNGSFGHQTVDHRVPSRGMDFAFMRYYRSGIQYPGPLGHNWDHAYNIRVVAHPPPAARLVPGGWCEPYSAATTAGPLTYYNGTGRVTDHTFASWEIREVSWCDANFTAIVTTYRQNDGEVFEIQRYALLSGAPPPVITDPIFFRIMHRGGRRDLLNCHGRVMEIRDVNHNATRFAYGLPFDPGTKYFVLKKVTDSLGREYRLDYRILYGGPRIVSITDPWQRQLRLAYDGDQQLERVTIVTGAAGTPEIVYRYGGGQRTGLLREIVNPVEAAGSQEAWLQNTYDGRERVVRQRVGTAAATTPRAGGSHRLQYPTPTRVIVRDRVNATWQYTLKAIGSSKVMESASLRDQVGTGGTITSKNLQVRFAYDRHYHVEKIVHPGGREEHMRYRNRNLRTLMGDELDDVLLGIAHHNDLGRDALMSHKQNAAGGTPAFETTYKYEWLYGGVLEVRTPMGLTKLEYDQGKCATPEYNLNPIKATFPSQLLPGGGSLPVVTEYDYATGGVPKYRKDPDSVEEEWLIDANGRIRQHTIGGQLVEGFTYYDRGTIETKTDARNRTWTYYYDDRDLIFAEDDPLGHRTVFIYNLNDWRILSQWDRVDEPTTIPGIHPQALLRVQEIVAFDILGQRRTQTELALGGTGTSQRTWRWTFDGEGRITLLETPRATAGQRADARVRTQYNARGQVYKTTTAYSGFNAGTTTTYYDDEGRPALSVDAIGNRTVTRYDGLGRLETEERANGTVRHFEYSGLHLAREWIEGPLNARPVQLGGSTVTRVLSEVIFQVDANHRPIQRTIKIFDPRQRPSIASGGGSDWTEQTWLTAAGRIRRQRDPAGHKVVFDWNAQGRIEKLTLPAGHTMIYAYDGALVKTITSTLKPDAGVTGPLPPADLVLTETNTYDDLGRRITHENAYGTVVNYAYDSRGNLRAKRAPVLQGQFSLTQYTYDPLGRMASLTTDGVASASNPDGIMKLSFQHDLNDNRIVMVDDLQRRTVTTFDGRDLPITLDQPEQRLMSYKRQRDGLVRRIERAGGTTTTISYTPTGAIASVFHQGSGTRVRQTFGYDGMDRLWWAADSNGGNRFRVQTYRGRDSMGRVVSERTAIPEFNFNKTIIYKYGFGQLDIGYPDATSRAIYKYDSDGNTDTISLNGVGQLVKNWHQGPGRLLQTERTITLSASQPQPQHWNLKLRTSQRYDAQGRVNFRVLHVTDEINRPGQPNYLPLSTHSEKTTYEVNGLPRRRNYGVLTQPGTFVDATFVYDGLSRAKIITEGEGSDWVNFDYDWDGAGRLNLFELNGRQAGQIIDEKTTMSYTQGQRVDRRRSGGTLASTTTWKFDGDGRLTDAQVTHPAGRRQFAYDANDRLNRVDVFTPGFLSTSQDTSRFLYDAFGRVVARLESNSPKEYFIYDRSRLAQEFNAQQRPIRRYIYDSDQQLIFYSLRETGNRWRNFHPLVTADGSPWVLLDADPRVTHLPTPPGASAASPTRNKYYRKRLPLIIEEYRWRPFEKGQIIRYDHASGVATGSVVDVSLLPLDSGGRRYFAAEKLFANGPRYYDPELRSYISPDPLGAWGHPMAFGNPYAYAANNPVAFSDDGNHPALVGLAVVMLVGALVGGAINAARQGIQMLEDPNKSFSLGEFGFSVFLGGIAAPVLVFAPELAIPLIGVGLYQSVGQYNRGEIGGATLAFDIAVMVLPFGFKGVRAGVAGRGTVIGKWRGLGPAATMAERGSRFTSIGNWTTARLGGRAAATRRFRPSTLEKLRELGGRDIEHNVPDADIAQVTKDTSLGEGTQGEVFEMKYTEESLVLKVFESEGGAAAEITGLHEFQIALQARQPGTGTPTRIVRVVSAGKTTTGRSFIIKEFARGSIPEGINWLNSGGHAELMAAMQARHPSYQTGVGLSLLENLLRAPDGSIIIFDPM